METWDVIIIGGGPAGLTAGIYTARARMRSLMLEAAVPGGLIAITDVVENYPGLAGPVKGIDLADTFRQQAEKFGLEIKAERAEKMEIHGKMINVKTDMDSYRCRSVIIATGSEPKKMGIPMESELAGRGVSYCATCDGAFFKGKEVVVVGGGDSAIKEAVFLTRFASRVYVIHRRDELRAEKIIQEQAFKEPKIQIIYDSVAVEIIGGKTVEGIKVRNVKDSSVRTINASGVFMYVGYEPATVFVSGLVDTDPAGYIKAGEDTKTNVPGIFAAGDVRVKKLRQIATAVGDGATAAMAAEEYVQRLGDATS